MNEESPSCASVPRIPFLPSSGELDPGATSRRLPGTAVPLVDTWMRDPQITVGRDAYYLSGVTRDPANPDSNTARWNDGARLWRSTDLVNWQPLGLVARLDDGPAWMSNYHVRLNNLWGSYSPGEFAVLDIGPDTPVQRSWWGLKMLYSKSRDSYFLCGSLNQNMGPANKWFGHRFGGCFLLESRTGEPTGPYRATSEFPMTHYIDPFLFEDDDGSLWFLWQGGWLGRLNERCDGLVEVNRPWMTEFDPEPILEGVSICKHEGRYHLGLATSAWWMGDHFTLGHRGHGSKAHLTAYCNLVASADSLHGPFGPRYLSILNGGHACPFADRDGQWWALTHTPPGDPLVINSGRGAVTPHLRPYLIAMQWIDGKIVPDLERSEAFYQALRAKVGPSK